MATEKRSQVEGLVANEICVAIEKWKPREMGSKRETSIALDKWKPSREIGG